MNSVGDTCGQNHLGRERVCVCVLQGSQVLLGYLITSAAHVQVLKDGLLISFTPSALPHHITSEAALKGLHGLRLEDPREHILCLDVHSTTTLVSIILQTLVSYHHQSEY